jgi:hypothetical protein
MKKVANVKNINLVLDKKSDILRGLHRVSTSFTSLLEQLGFIMQHILNKQGKIEINFTKS